MERNGLRQGGEGFTSQCARCALRLGNAQGFGTPCASHMPLFCARADCMAYPRHALQSVELSQVTQVCERGVSRCEPPR